MKKRKTIIDFRLLAKLFASLLSNEECKNFCPQKSLFTTKDRKVRSFYA